MAAANLNQLVIGGLSLVGPVVFVVCAISFLVWFFRAYRATGSIPGQELNYNRWWTIWGFVVPIVSLFRPVEIALEIWKKTGRREKGSGAFLLLGWWVLFLVAGALALAAVGVAASSNAAQGVQFIAFLLTASYGLRSLAACLAIVVVAATDRRLALALRFEDSGAAPSAGT